MRALVLIGIITLLAACDSGAMEEEIQDFEAPPAVAPFMGEWNLNQLVRTTEGNNESLAVSGTYRLQVTLPAEDLVNLAVQVEDGGSFVASDVFPGFTCSTLDFSDASPALNCERFRVGRRETLALTLAVNVLSGTATRWATDTAAEWTVTMSGTR